MMTVLALVCSLSSHIKTFVFQAWGRPINCLKSSSFMFCFLLLIMLHFGQGVLPIFLIVILLPWSYWLEMLAKRRHLAQRSSRGILGKQVFFANSAEATKQVIILEEAASGPRCYRPSSPGLCFYPAMPRGAIRCLRSIVGLVSCTWPRLGKMLGLLDCLQKASLRCRQTDPFHGRSCGVCPPSQRASVPQQDSSRALGTRQWVCVCVLYACVRAHASAPALPPAWHPHPPHHQCPPHYQHPPPLRLSSWFPSLRK